MTSSYRQRVTLGQEGDLVLPQQAREALQVSEGEELILTVRDGEVRLQTMRSFTREIQAKYAGKLDGAVDALIAERRAEAARE